MSASAPAEEVSRLTRFVELSPVFAALGLHAVAHGRWLLCAPVAAGLLVAVLAGVRPKYSPGRLLLAGALGGGAGALMLWVGEPPSGPFPPQVLGPLCGALVGFAVLCGLCRNRLYAWTYAFLLVALSLSVRGSGALPWALGLVGLSVLAVSFQEGGLARAGLGGVVGFLAFVAVLGGLSLPLVRTLHASEGLLMETFYRLTNGASPGSGSGLQSVLDIGALARMPRGSTRPLLVVSGARPERLRTRVFDRFDGERWTTSEALEGKRLALPGEEAEGEKRMAMTVLRPLGHWLPVPAGTREVDGVRPEVRGGWVVRVEESEGMTFGLRVDGEDRLPAEEAPGEVLTELPEALEAELRPLAEALTGEGGTAREKARALEAYFRDGYEYSLDVDLRGEGSPLAVLVREKRAAYCTYFASAMAALLRTVEVPARVVGGFAPEGRNPLTGASVVRERDAHAWVEVYLEEEGRFVAFDPTPWRSRDEALGVEGSAGVLGSVVEAVTTLMREWGALLRYQPLALVRAVGSSPLFWLLVGVGFVWRLRGRVRRGRGRRQRGAMGGKDARLEAAYARYLRTLKRRAGLVPGPAETDEELLERLRAARGDAVAEVAARFLESYREARYRGGVAEAPWREQVEELDAALRAERLS